VVVRAQRFVLASVFLDVLSIGLVMPVMPALIRQFAREDDVAYWYPWLMGLFAFLQFGFAPVLGAASDRWGRKPLLLISNLGLAAYFGLTACAASLAGLVVARIIGGTTSATMSVAYACAADRYPRGERAGEFARINAMYGLGIIVGPAIGGLLGSVDPRITSGVAAGICAANALYGWIYVAESRTPQPAPLDRSLNPLLDVMRVRIDPGLRPLLVAFGCMAFAQAAATASWILSFSYRLHWGNAQCGLSLALVGLTSAIAQGVLFTPLLRHLGERTCLLVSTICGGVAYVGFGLAATTGTIYGVIALNLIAPIARPAIQAVFSRAVHDSRQGALMGLLNSVTALAGFGAPFLLAPVLAYGARPAVAGSSLAGAPFLVAAGLQAAGLIGIMWPAGTRSPS
jgi:DHA1 family tetracycline resistance protein-like MFS transporter